MKLISWNVNGIRACMTKGFKDFKACSPKTRAYIISSQNEITSKLYGDISKQCSEVNKEVEKEVKIETPNVTTI